jgi:hypothetical protein
MEYLCRKVKKVTTSPIHPIFQLRVLPRSDDSASDTRPPLRGCDPDTRSPSLPRWGSRALAAIVPHPGSCFVRWDWTGQRERLLAEMAGVPQLASWLNSATFDAPKLAVLEGWLRGESDRAILDANRLLFGTSQKTILLLRQQLSAQFPEVPAWQQAVLRRAHEQQHLVNRFGELRWFYEVYAPDQRGGWRAGDQAVAAIRFLPESEAAGIARWRLRELRVNHLLAAWRMVGYARDWIIMEVEREWLGEHVRALWTVMAAAPPQMTGAAGGSMLPTVLAGMSWLEWTKLDLRQQQEAGREGAD